MKRKLINLSLSSIIKAILKGLRVLLGAAMVGMAAALGKNIRNEDEKSNYNVESEK